MYVFWIVMVSKNPNPTLDDCLTGVFPCVLLCWMMPAFLVVAIIIVFINYAVNIFSPLKNNQ
jgi:hypothetical protein